MREKNKTIKDISKILGISPSTVSKALNNYSDISKETRDKVIKVAREIDYTPNILAKSLVTDVTNRIGLLIEDFEKDGLYNSFYYDILMGFKQEASNNNYEVLLLSTSSEEQKRVSFNKIMSEKQLAGVFVMGLRLDDEYYKEIQNSDYPIVLLDIYMKKPNIGCISVNSLKGAELAINHLVETGHTRIGYVNGHKEAYVSKERLNGYLLSLIKNNLTYDPSMVYEGDFSEESGASAAMYFTDKDVTAVFCASDLMAIGAINKFIELGKKVPDDISVVGFDNINLSSYITPSLTTVNQNKAELGKSAYYLLENIMKKQPFNQVLLEPELIIRSSTKRLK